MRFNAGTLSRRASIYMYMCVYVCECVRAYVCQQSWLVAHYAIGFSRGWQVVASECTKMNSGQQESRHKNSLKLSKVKANILGTQRRMQIQHRGVCEEG